MSSNNSCRSIAEEFAIKTQREQKKASAIQIMPVIVLVFLVLFFSVACPSSFLTLYNLRTILNQLSITLIISLGITFVILTGSVDLSVDGVVGLAGSLVSVLVLNSKYSTNLGMLGVLISILAGVACGFVSGLGQFTRNYTQTVKRAADNKRRYAPGWVHSTCLLRGFPKGAAPHLAHDFAEQSVVYYTLCRRCPENTVAAGEGKGI